MLDAAIVGLGRWGEALVNSVHGKSNRIRFVRAVTRTPAKAKDFAAKVGIPVDFDYDAALKDPKIRAIVLATPHTQHADQIIAAAKAGKHVFVEKPFTLTRASAEQAIAACEKAKVAIAVGLNRRFLPPLLELKRLASTGALGPLLHVEGIFAVNLGGPADAWRNSRAESPAGGMTSLGIHALDMMIGIAGPITEVTALTQQRAITSWDIDDTTVMLFRHKSGATGCPAVEGENQYHGIFSGGPCHAVHPSDPAVALTALEATVLVVGRGLARRRVPMAEFYAGAAENPRGEAALADGEIIEAVELPPESAGGTQRFVKLMQRGAWDFALVSLAAVKRTDGEVRLVLGGVAPQPYRVNPSIEQDVESGALDDVSVDALAERALYDAAPLSGNGYKVKQAAALLKRAMRELSGA